ncbi:MAG: YqaE/Pmp3 family membrane protein [Bacteroidetes bacterium]|nr:YqaE/Pmp3 family membrane protein [Bacteroidota bacterium]
MKSFSYLKITLSFTLAIFLLFSCTTGRLILTKSGSTVVKPVNELKEQRVKNTETLQQTDQELVSEESVTIETNDLSSVKSEKKTFKQKETEVSKSVKETEIRNENSQNKSKHSFTSHPLRVKSELKKSVDSQMDKLEKKNISKGGDMVILYYILAVLIPFLAVGLVTNWDLTLVVISVLLMFLFYIPAIVFAIIIVAQNT